MPRLPIPGQDDGAWGDILNEYLSVELDANGVLKLRSDPVFTGKASDSAVVHNTGAETVAGTKTFQSSPVIPSPTLGSHAANRTYVDAAVAAVPAPQTPTQTFTDALAYGLQASTMPLYGVNTTNNQLNSGIFVVALIRPGAITVTNLGCWLTVVGLTSTGVSAMALYSESGTLISQTSDMTSVFSGTAGFIEAPLGTPQTLADATNYYIAVLTHFSTGPRVAGLTITPTTPQSNFPSVKGHISTVALSGQSSLPASFTPGTASKNNGFYYFTMS